MRIHRRHCKQRATWWVRAGKDKYASPTWVTPVPVKVRWEHATRTAVDAEGNEYISQDTVYVDREMTVGDKIMLGVSASPVPPTGSIEIKSFERVPNLQNTEVILKALG